MSLQICHFLSLSQCMYIHIHVQSSLYIHRAWKHYLEINTCIEWSQNLYALKGMLVFSNISLYNVLYVYVCICLLFYHSSWFSGSPQKMTCVLCDQCKNRDFAYLNCIQKTVYELKHHNVKYCLWCLHMPSMLNKKLIHFVEISFINVMNEIFPPLILKITL